MDPHTAIMKKTVGAAMDQVGSEILDRKSILNLTMAAMELFDLLGSKMKADGSVS